MMLPEGWAKCRLGEIIKLSSGDGRPSDTISEPDSTRSIPVYGGNGILGYSSHFNSDSDDIIIGRVGENCGVTRFVSEKKWITDNALFTTEINGICSTRYLTLVLQAFDLSKLRSKGGQPLVSQKPIYSQSFVLPPRQEQERIVCIFSDWDKAVAAQEKLIANARAQKKALMQQLLTGKKRLPGFTGEWEPTRLDRAAHIIVSNVDKKSHNGQRPVRLCNYMDVYESDRIEANMTFMHATASEAQIKKFGLRVGDVLITKDSETPDDIAVPAYVASTAPDLVCGYHLAMIRPKKGTDGQFLKHYFEHPPTQYFLASHANGATRFGLTVDAIESAPIALPSYAEQQRIGAVISNAEFEIQRLLPIVEGLRQEKSALMQQLLTGKRRVMVQEAVEPA